MFDSRRVHSIEGLRKVAKRRLPKAIFDFFDGGAEDELTLSDNRSAFNRVKLSPKCLVNVAKVCLDTELVGGRSALPLAVAPTGAVGFGRHGGDIDVAKSAIEAGVPYTLSTSATASIEQIADAAAGRLWFQAYILKDKELLSSLLFRAKSAGYEALMITVDLPVGGKRERDFHNHLSFPFRYTPRNLLDFSSRPAWAIRMLRYGLPVMENLKGLEAPSTSATKLASSVGKNYDPSFDWDSLKKLRDEWPHDFIVKGVMRADDAIRLADMGCDGIVVSNHGGRQLDGAAATLDILPSIVRAVEGRVPVLVDGGVRRGVDILKARALGAQGVLTGRATLWGAVADGQRGATQALAILRDELQRSMQLCGVRSVEEISRDLLFECQGPGGAESVLGKLSVPSP